MKTQTKAKILSRTVRAVLSHNGDIKLMHFNALIDLVGGDNASKLLDMKVVNQNPLKPLTLSDKRNLLNSTNNPVTRLNGKVVVQIFGRYIPLFIY